MNAYNLESVKERELFPGFVGKFIHSDNMTFVYWDIAADSPLPAHSHPHEQVINMFEGRFEISISGGETRVLGPGRSLRDPRRRRALRQSDHTLQDPGCVSAGAGGVCVGGLIKGDFWPKWAAGEEWHNWKANALPFRYAFFPRRAGADLRFRRHVAGGLRSSWLRV